MALGQRLTSSHFPYLPLHLELGPETYELEALLDTGFDGDIAISRQLPTSSREPDVYLPCLLADGSELLTPLYRGVVRVGDLKSFPVAVLAIGDETLVGRGVSDRFTLILDHGRQITVEV